METDLALLNCTLYQRFIVGLVEQDEETKTTEGYTVLRQIFDELNDAYKLANIEDGFELTERKFDSSDDLEDYVRDRDYVDKPLCFALSWHEFNSEEKIFSLNLQWNYGDQLATRLPQTEYEESSQNQLYLNQYANYGVF